MRRTRDRQNDDKSTSFKPWDGKNVSMLRDTMEIINKDTFVICYNPDEKEFKSIPRIENGEYVTVVCGNGNSCVCKLLYNSATRPQNSMPSIYLSKSAFVSLGYSFSVNNQPSIVSISSFKKLNANIGNASSINISVVLADSSSYMRTIFGDGDTELTADKLTTIVSLIQNRISKNNRSYIRSGSYIEFPAPSQPQQQTSIDKGGNAASTSKAPEQDYLLKGVGFFIHNISDNAFAQNQQIISVQSYFQLSSSVSITVDPFLISKSKLENLLLSIPNTNSWITRGIYSDVFRTLFYMAILPMKVPTIFNDYKSSSLSTKSVKGIILSGLDYSSRVELVRVLSGISGVKLVILDYNTVLSKSLSDNFKPTNIATGAIDISKIAVSSSVQSPQMVAYIKSTFDAVNASGIPSIIFIKDCDILCPNISQYDVGGDGGGSLNGGGGGKQDNNALLRGINANMLKEQIEKLYTNNNQIIVIASSQRSEKIDSSLRSYGILEREICIPMPDASSREIIISKMSLSTSSHSVFKKMDKTTISQVSKLTSGYGFDDIASLFKQASIKCVERLYPRSPETIQSGGELKISPNEQLTMIYDDFQSASKMVIASSLKSFSSNVATRSDTSWKDVMGSSFLRDKFNDMLMRPRMYSSLYDQFGSIASIPRGVLMYGPPGNGKTLTASAVANECGYSFISVKSTEIFQKYLGESERMIRDIFNTARNAAPCIVFFDEIDAIGLSRTGNNGSAEASSITGSKVLITLLMEMDSIEKKSDVLVIAATNRPDVLDTALLRPGRFNELLYVGMPDYFSRLLLINGILMKSAPSRHLCLDDVIIDFIRKFQEDGKKESDLVFSPNSVYSPVFKAASMTDGCSNADITEMCRNAANMAISRIISSQGNGEETDVDTADGFNFEPNARRFASRNSSGSGIINVDNDSIEKNKMLESDLIFAASNARRSVSKEEVEGFLRMQLKYKNGV